MSRAPARTACAAPGCSISSAPTSRRSPPAPPGSRSPELLRLSNEDLAAVAAPNVAGAAAGAGRRALRAPARAGAARRAVLGLLPPRQPLPGGASRRGGRALGADRQGRPGAAGGPRARRDGHRRRRPPRQLLRARGRPRAGPRAGRGRDRRGQRPRLRHRRLRPPRRARRRRPRDRRPRLRARLRLPRRAPLALAADLRERPGPLRAAAGGDPVALDLPGAQPDHGGAGRDDRRGRGRGALRLADHRRPRRRPGPRPGGGARAGRLAAPRPARTTCWPAAPAWSAARRTSSTRCSGPGRDRSSGRGRRWSRSCSTRWARSSGAREPATRSPSNSACPARRRPPRSPGSRCSATSPAPWSASIPGHSLQPPDRHLGCGRGFAAHSSGPLDRRLRLRRRGRHPGRPEGVRALSVCTG